MANPCAAILIDPFARTVTQVQWNGDYHHIYELTQCDTYDCARINRHGDGVFVDDEGLFKEEQAFFLIEGYPTPLAGRGLLLGCDEEGESVTPHMSLEEAREAVMFVLPARVNGQMRLIPMGKHAEAA